MSPCTPHCHVINPGNFVVSVVHVKIVTKIQREKAWGTHWNACGYGGRPAKRSSATAAKLRLQGRAHTHAKGCTHTHADPKYTARTSIRTEFRRAAWRCASASNSSRDGRTSTLSAKKRRRRERCLASALKPRGCSDRENTHGCSALKQGSKFMQCIASVQTAPPAPRGSSWLTCRRRVRLWWRAGFGFGRLRTRGRQLRLAATGVGESMMCHDVWVC